MERAAYTAAVAASCWRELDRWLEYHRPFCGYCPRSVLLRMEPRCARSHATPAFVVQLSKLGGTRCLHVAVVRTLGPGTPTCCCCPGRYECESPTSILLRALFRGWPGSHSVFSSSPLRRNWTWISGAA